MISTFRKQVEVPDLTFVLLREGPSDEGLIPILRVLLAQSGFDEVNGSARAYKGSVSTKLGLLLKEEATPGLVFVHRDADSEDPGPRYAEIAGAIRATDCAVPCIGVIPIQELEAWLLVAEDEIRAVAGRPGGTHGIALPRLGLIEKTASPKEVLREALLFASETTGRRRAARAKGFDRDRQTLLQRLDIHGPVRSLRAWRQLENDIAAFAKSMGINPS